MIKVTDNLKSEDASILISKIFSLCAHHPYLASRTKRELQKAYGENRLLVACDNSKIIGWMIIINLSLGVQELASAYVEEHYRMRGIFTLLLKKALSKTHKSIFVTYNRDLESLLLKTGFGKSSFLEIVKVGGSRFLINRFNFRRLISIRNHYKMLRPMYFVYNK